MSGRHGAGPFRPGNIPSVPYGSTAYISFTDRGAELAERLRKTLGGEAVRAGEGQGISLTSWTATAFAHKHALVYVGAVGIAVRAVAPYLQGKAVDPAVVAVDEHGRFAVPVVSGHLGGANDLARTIAAITGGTAVITTATDLNGVFAVDEWAKWQNCAVIHVSAVKRVSGKLLAGEVVRLYTAFPIRGTPPKGIIAHTGEPIHDADVWVDVRRHPELSVAPRMLTLGIGCRKGIRPEILERRFAALCREFDLWPEAVECAATVDIKAEESGLLDFCAAHGWPLRLYTAEQLRNVPGTFTASDFVRRKIGVNNVCERAAVRGSKGELLVRKYAGEGVTLALARRPFRMDWNW